MAKIGVVGTTSWGTTLGIIAAKEGHEVRLWARSEEEATLLRSSGENGRFLPGAPFPAGLDVTASAQEALHGAEMAIVAVPSPTMRENLSDVRDALDDSTVVVSATKGLEVGTARRMSQLIHEELPSSRFDKVCALSGPNLASEIIDGKPSSTVVASPNEDAAMLAQSLLRSSRFRVYTNTDIVGVELGGALKNIVAIGAGVCDGFGVGDNAKAAFITRGLAEIARIGAAAGGDPATLAGLAGMGDLIATCASPLSRNHQVGEQLAAGKTLPEIKASMSHVAEGITTTMAALTLAEKLNVEMPITQTTYEVLYDGLPIDKAIVALMERAPSPE